MLVFDSHERIGLGNERLAAYMAGEKVSLDDGEFKEEDHPRVGVGSGKGGQFVKSNKTIEKEDNLSDEEEDSELKECDKKMSNAAVIRLKKKAASGKATLAELEKLAFAERYTSENANCEIQEAVANNPNTPDKVLKHLANFPHQNEDYRGKVYNTTGVSLAALANLENRKKK